MDKLEHTSDQRTIQTMGYRRRAFRKKAKTVPSRIMANVFVIAKEVFIDHLGKISPYFSTVLVMKLLMELRFRLQRHPFTF